MALSRRQLIGLLLAPLPAVSIGLAVMSGAGVPATTWLLNAAAVSAGVVGVLGAGLWRRTGAPGAPPLGWLAPLGLALLGATLLTPGVEGVRRWLPLGPLQLHVDAVLLPPILVVLGRARWGMSVGVTVVTLVILLLQPDPAQAASFAVGWIVLVAASRGRHASVWIIVAAALAAGSLVRPDPLGPVPHVEGIVGLAMARGLPWAAAGVVSLMVVPLSLGLGGRGPGMSLAAYVGTTLLAAWLGDYPVPFLGYGVSPILGYYAALAALAWLRDGA